MKTEDELR